MSSPCEGGEWGGYKFINARLSFIGNSNLEGAGKLLLNKKVVNEAIHIAITTQSVDLSLIRDFESVFVREMQF